MRLKISFDHKFFKLRSFQRLAGLTVIVLVVGVIGLYVKGELEHYLVTAAHQPISITETFPASYKPSELGQIQGKSITVNADYQDPRAHILDSYFKLHDSPLYGTGEIFVKACDKYGAPKDCTTVAGIAHAETNLCKYHTSAEYHNCWGFGGGGEYRMYFGSWEESIDLVTDRLVNSYGPQYMIDPSLMEDTFCGSEPGCTNWGSRVKYFMNAISDHARDLGFSYSLFDLR